MAKTSSKPTIAVDLDGTIAQYEQWLGESVIGEPIEGAVDFIIQLEAAGFDVVIFSARAGTKEGSDAIWAWLSVAGLDKIVSEVTNVKQYRFAAMVDDRAVAYGGPMGRYQDILVTLRGAFGVVSGRDSGSSGG